MSFQKYFSIERYIAASKQMGKAAYGKDGIKYPTFAKNIESEAAIAVKAVQSGQYTFTNYLEKLVPKSFDSNPRQISVPTFRDKCTLIVMKEYIQLHFPEHYSRHQLAIVDHIKNSLSGYHYYLKTDIKGYFPSIPHDQMLIKLSEKIQDEYFIELTKRSINNHTTKANQKPGHPRRLIGIPQGIPTSNIMAEIYASQLDEVMSKYVFFRYMDDMLVLALNKEEVEEASEVLRKKCFDLKIEISSDKTVLADTKDGFTYLGYSFEDPNIIIRDSAFEGQFRKIASIIGRFEHEVNNPRKKLSKNERLIARARFLDDFNRQITGAVYRGKKYGFTFYFSKINSTHQLHHLDKFVEDELEKIKHLLETKVKIKKHVKSYYAWRSLDPSQYIPNYDVVMNSANKGKYLARYGIITRDVNLYTTDEIEQIYDKFIRKKLRKIDEFVGNLS